MAIAALVGGAIAHGALASTPERKTLAKPPHHIFRAHDELDKLEMCLRPGLGKVPGNLVIRRVKGRTDFILNEGLWIVSLIGEGADTRIEERFLLLPAKGLDKLIRECGGSSI